MFNSNPEYRVPAKLNIITNQYPVLNLKQFGKVNIGFPGLFRKVRVSIGKTNIQFGADFAQGRTSRFLFRNK